MSHGCRFSFFDASLRKVFAPRPVLRPKKSASTSRTMESPLVRRPPDILSVTPSGGGDITVVWQVDTFYLDTEEPETVSVILNGLHFAELDGGDTSIVIPQATLAALGTGS